MRFTEILGFGVASGNSPLSILQGREIGKMDVDTLWRRKRPVEVSRSWSKVNKFAMRK